METKMIVAGGRDFNDYEYLKTKILELADQYECLSLVSGTARGADALAIKFSKEFNCVCYEFHADWSIGRSAGYVCNKQMADFSDVLLAFWDGQSRGTKHMIQTMQTQGKTVIICGY